jgi:putative exporter of polyketide antibiotics
MRWWFIVLGFSALVIVCVAIALYLRVRRHLGATEPRDGADAIEPNHSDPV